MGSPPFKIALRADSAVEFPDETFRLIREILKVRKGFDLGSYKDKCMKRRIAIRVRATRCATPEEYCALLLRNREEMDLLLKVLTIHVTQFFRNPSTFAKLKDEIIPSLFLRAEAEGREALVFWSVGCASGEEPYTLSLLLRDAFPAETARTRVSILATDVDAEVLETARKGCYDRERLAEMPQAMKERYFAEEGGRYCLLPAVKETVSFSRSDLFHPDAYPESDLILCRNVLIYFERKEQEKILQGFARSLHPGGFLVLGKSETLAERSRFTTVCPVERIYRRA